MRPVACKKDVKFRIYKRSLAMFMMICLGNEPTRTDWILAKISPTQTSRASKNNCEVSQSAKNATLRKVCLNCHDFLRSGTGWEYIPRSV